MELEPEDKKKKELEMTTKDNLASVNNETSDNTDIKQTKIQIHRFFSLDLWFESVGVPFTIDRRTDSPFLSKLGLGFVMQQHKYNTILNQQILPEIEWCDLDDNHGQKVW